MQATDSGLDAATRAEIARTDAAVEAVLAESEARLAELAALLEPHIQRTLARLAQGEHWVGPEEAPCTSRA